MIKNAHIDTIAAVLKKDSVRKRILLRLTGDPDAKTSSSAYHAIRIVVRISSRRQKWCSRISQCWNWRVSTWYFGFRDSLLGGVAVGRGVIVIIVHDHSVAIGTFEIASV